MNEGGKTLRVEIYKETLRQDVAALFYSVFTASPWEYTWLTMDKILRYFQDLANTPQFLGFVCMDEHEIIGACLGCISDYFLSSQYDIKEIFVRSSLQNKGLGSRFLQAVEAELKNRDVGLMALYTQKTIAAHDFYLKNGYEANPDTLFMTKVL